ncbi:hypothetical protein AAVH_05873 [Aphelenchoides avenae]|nr:hypothetical protein AAVH_05873 [Aphelenchus avenae]
MKGLVLLTTVAFVVPYAGDACAAGGDKCLYDPTCRAALTQLMELFLSPTNVPLLTLTQKGQLYQLNAALTLTLQQLQSILAICQGAPTVTICRNLLQAIQKPARPPPAPVSPRRVPVFPPPRRVLPPIAGPMLPPLGFGEGVLPEPILPIDVLMFG